MVTTARAPEWRSMCASSWAVAQVLMATVVAPRPAMPKKATSHSGRFGISSATWSPAATPRSARPRENARDRRLSSP